MSFPTASDQQAGVAAYNEFVARVWEKRRPEIEKRLQEAVSGLADGTAIGSVKDVVAEIEAPPRLTITIEAEDLRRVEFALPGEGRWRVRATLGLPLGGKLKLALENISATVRMLIHGDDPGEARVEASQAPSVTYDVTVKKSGLLRVFFSSSKLKTVRDFIQLALLPKITAAVAEELPKVDVIEANQALGLGSGAPPIPDEPLDLAAMEAAALEISNQMPPHLPFRTALSVERESADPAAPVIGYRHFHDSAIWTGHYVAAEALRFAVTGDTAAAENARKPLEGLRDLISLTRDRGLLCRALVPDTEENAPHIEQLVRDGGDRVFGAEIDGEKFKTMGHVSRDQYLGAILGTGLAAKLFTGQPEVADLAHEVATAMTAYLVETGWSPTNGYDDHVATTYLFWPAQVLAFLKVAATLDPDRFGEELERAEPIWSVVWFFQKLQSLDEHSSYYKFNLEHGASLLLLLLEQDAAERRKWRHGFRVVRQALAAHRNAYFDLVELAGSEGDDAALTRPRQEIEREVRFLLKAWLARPRNYAVGSVDPSSVETVEYQFGDGSTETIARDPVPMPNRPSTDFLWQRSPFFLAEVVFEGPEITPPGIDYLLPYWLARHLGVIGI